MKGLIALGLIVSGAAACATAAPSEPARSSAHGPAQASLESVRSALEATFAARMRAYAAKDYQILVDQIAPSYHATRPDGSTMNRDDLASYVRRNLDRWVRIIHQSNIITGLRLEGGNAVADVRQALSRIQIVDGREAVVTSKVLQTETWTPTPAGWKLLGVKDERDMELTIDGRPVG